MHNKFHCVAARKLSFHFSSISCLWNFDGLYGFPLLPSL